MSKIEELVFEMAKPIAHSCGVELYDVEFKKEGQDRFLRIFLFDKNGITLEKCEEVSRLVSDELDRTDPISEAYYLEVSSPGIDRVLRRDSHFGGAIGEEIEIKLYGSLNGKKYIRGKLSDYRDGIVFLTDGENTPHEINKNDTAQIKIYWE